MKKNGPIIYRNFRKIIFNVNYFNKINKKGKKYATRISINESYEKKHGFN